MDEIEKLKLENDKLKIQVVNLTRRTAFFFISIVVLLGAIVMLLIPHIKIV